MILVTGATGKTASRVATALRAQGQEVRALTRDADRARETLGADVDVVAGQWADEQVLDRALVGIERVFLAVGSAPGQDLLEELLIDASVRSSGRPHIVKLSTYGAERAAKELPQYHVADWHRAAERQLAASGLPTTVLRPNAFMDLLAAAGSVSRQDALSTSTGDGRVSMVDNRDVADVAVAVLTGDGHVGKDYAITGGEAVSYPEVATTMSAVLGREISLVPVEEADVSGALTQMGVPAALVPV